MRRAKLSSFVFTSVALEQLTGTPPHVRLTYCVLFIIITGTQYFGISLALSRSVALDRVFWGFTNPFTNPASQFHVCPFTRTSPAGAGGAPRSGKPKFQLWTGFAWFFILFSTEFCLILLVFRIL